MLHISEILPSMEIVLKKDIKKSTQIRILSCYGIEYYANMYTWMMENMLSKCSEILLLSNLKPWKMLK